MTVHTAHTLTFDYITAVIEGRHAEALAIYHIMKTRLFVRTPGLFGDCEFIMIDKDERENYPFKVTDLPEIPHTELEWFVSRWPIHADDVENRDNLLRLLNAM